MLGVNRIWLDCSVVPEVESGRRRMRSAEPESSGVRVDVRVIEGARRAKSSSKVRPCMYKRLYQCVLATLPHALGLSMVSLPIIVAHC